MRFEKVSEDKIRITLTNEDLEKNDIDYHDFMTDSIESQDLFFDMLKEAEKEIGFVTKDYLIRIEAFACAGGRFILTVTRTLPPSATSLDSAKTYSRKKPHTKRKTIDFSTNVVIYAFSSFDNFCDFCEFYKNSFGRECFANRVILYEYNGTYYLAISNINFGFENLRMLFSSITEFATFVSNYASFESKLNECANLIIDNDAIKLALKYFVK